MGAVHAPGDSAAGERGDAVAGFRGNGSEAYPRAGLQTIATAKVYASPRQKTVGLREVFPDQSTFPEQVIGV